MIFETYQRVDPTIGGSRVFQDFAFLPTRVNLRDGEVEREVIVWLEPYYRHQTLLRMVTKHGLEIKWFTNRKTYSIN